MKLKKHIITEADEQDIINPSADSISDIATKVTDQVEIATDGEKTLTPGAASAVASEMKATAAETGATGAAIVDDDADSLETENRITKTLDLAYKASKREARRTNNNIKTNSNVLICGLPGSGKTASVYDWAKSTKNHERINLIYVNAKDNDLEAFINGFTVRSEEDPRKVTKAYSNNLDDLEKPNSVLFLDEFNRQTSSKVRASLLTLINEHAVSGEDENKRHVFHNMLFTIAAINPALPTDEGAADLNDAEKSRFALKIKHADSDPAATVDYFTKNFDKKIKKLDPKDPYYREDLEGYLRQQDLGIFIATHPDFHYDTEDDMQSLYDEDHTMFNQRALTDGLAIADGNAADLLDWIDTNAADFLDNDVEMLSNIVKEYMRDLPSFEMLCKKKGINPDTGTITKPTKDTAAETDVDDGFGGKVAADSTLDDDPSMWSSGARATTGGIRAKSPLEAKAALSSIATAWTK